MRWLLIIPQSMGLGGFYYKFDDLLLNADDEA